MRPSPAFLRRFFLGDRYAAAAGVKLVEVRPGYARARMTIADRHLNGVDVAQGGALFTLADFAFAVACNSHGPVAVAVNVSISFLAAGLPGPLVAEAREVARSAKISTCEVEVRDRRGALVALFHGTAYVKKVTLAEHAAARSAPARSRARPSP